MLKWIANQACDASRAVLLVEGDGRQVLVAGKVDGVEITHGHLGARGMISVEISHASGRRLTLFMLRWWVLTTWLSLRYWLLVLYARRVAKLAGKTPRELGHGPPR